MQLVRINHARCDEYDGTEYVLAPDGWTEDKIRAEIGEVEREMIADAQAIQKPPFDAPSHQPEYSKYPDKTVAEVLADHTAQKARYAEWKTENKHLTRTFEKRLRERGFVGLWEEHADVVVVKAYWGHNHGLELNYKYAEGY